MLWFAYRALWSVHFRSIGRPCRRLCEGVKGNVDRLPFTSLPLSNDIQDKLRASGFETMFDIQQKALPVVLSGKDLVGRAQTGSGKTLCFTLPVIEKLALSQPCQEPRALMVFPTRELAIQIHDCLQFFAPALRLCLAYGGHPVDSQLDKLRQGCDIVTGTPGRLESFLRHSDLRLNKIQVLVLDEADTLLRPDFYDHVEELIRACPTERQTLLFSATFPKEARAVTETFMQNPEYIDIQYGVGQVPSTIKQIAMQIKEGREVGIIMHLLEKYKPKSCVIFVARRRSTNLLADYLQKIGVRCEAIHGQMSQAKREHILQRFRDGRMPVLIGTDVVARGLDVPELELVVQIEPSPQGTPINTHRCGRTGRAGRPGTSVLLYYDFQKATVADVRKVEPSIVEEPAPEPSENPDKPWEGTLSENFALGRDGEQTISTKLPRSQLVFGKQHQPFHNQHFGRSQFSHRSSHHQPFGQGSFDRQPRHQQPFNRQPYHQQPFDRQPYRQQSFDREPYHGRSFDRQLYREQSFDRHPYRQQSFDHEPYHGRSFDHQPYREQSFNHQPYRKESFDLQQNHQQSSHQPYSRQSFGGHQSYQNQPSSFSDDESFEDDNW